MLDYTHNIHVVCHATLHTRAIFSPTDGSACMVLAYNKVTLLPQTCVHCYVFNFVGVAHLTNWESLRPYISGTESAKAAEIFAMTMELVVYEFQRLPEHENLLV